MTDILLASLGIFIGEFYGNFVGGGSIVTQFFLQNLIGMELKQAIALDNAAVLGSELGLLYVLFKREKLQKSDLIFTAFILFGSYFGAQGLHLIPVEVLKYIFIAVLAIVVLKSFLVKTDPKAKKKKAHPVAFYSFAVMIGAYNAFLSVGDWLFALMGLVLLFGIPYRRSVFLLAFSLFFGRLFAASQYYSFGYIDFDFWIPMFFAALLSGMSAGLLIDKIKTDHIKPILKVLGLFLMIYLTVSLLG